MVEGWTKNLLSEMMVNSVTWIQKDKHNAPNIQISSQLDGGARRRSFEHNGTTQLVITRNNQQ